MACDFPYPDRDFADDVFGEVAEIVSRSGGVRNEFGEWAEGALAPATEIRVSTAPASESGGGGRKREVTIAGAQLLSERVFWGGGRRPVAATNDRDGDLIRWDDQLWRVVGVERWSDDLWEADTVRTVPQSVDVPVIGNTPLERDIRAHVADGSGIAATLVIPANDHGPVPVGLHATVLVMTDTQAGDSATAYRERGEDWRADVRAEKTAKVSIQFFRSGAKAAANALVGWLDTPLAKEAERRRGIVIDYPFETRDMAAVLAGEWEERIGIDLTIHYAQDTNQDVTAFNRAEVEAKSEDGGSATGTIDGRDS